MDAAEELVGIVDESGREVAAVPRSVMRRDNLLHRATGVVVRDSTGRIYVHRRTATKDVYPGMYDCCAGGVVAAGEDVEEAARRELAEELGVEGVELRPLFVAPYADEHTRYLAHVYEARWDGTIHWQADEVDWGQWMTPAQLRDLLADPERPFVPDSGALLSLWFAQA
jgi:isopentenyldiphosphate isomerase